MDLQLKDAHVLVTGASRGIGLACVREFLREGARVSLVARGADNMARVIEELRPLGTVAGYCADLSQAQEAQAVLEAIEKDHGPVAALVNCAGGAMKIPFDDLTPQVWQAAMASKFLAYINVIDPMVKRMGHRGQGSIVSVAGLGGKIGMTNHLAGGAANAALMLASAGLARAYGPRGVRLNVVNPELTATGKLEENLHAESLALGVAVEELRARSNQRLGLGRPARAEEVASAVVYLSSPRASYISGVALSVDGCTVALVM